MNAWTWAILIGVIVGIVGGVAYYIVRQYQKWKAYEESHTCEHCGAYDEFIEVGHEPVKRNKISRSTTSTDSRGKRTTYREEGERVTYKITLRCKNCGYEKVEFISKNEY